MSTAHRSTRALVAAAAVVAMLAVPGTAGAHSGHHRHRHRHHGPVLTAVQKQCLADHGFPVGDGQRPDLRDPAVRAALGAALRECGILPNVPPPPTTVPTDTAPPVISDSLRQHR